MLPCLKHAHGQTGRCCFLPGIKDFCASERREPRGVLFTSAPERPILDRGCPETHSKPMGGSEHDRVASSHRPLVLSAVEWRRGVTCMRMDKWLWAARFFKTRALAARACELGRVTFNGQPAKASREVHTGDRLLVKSDSGEFQLDVLMLSEVRGPAAIAQTLYHETEASQELRQKLAEERKALSQFAALREGKPSKRDRRELARLRGRS